MTTPVDPTTVQTVSLASVDELLAQARRLGLVWSLRPGTVTNITNGASAYNPRVVMDGDDANADIQVTSLVGGVAVDMRVMVMFVPPIGNYVIGIISTAHTQRYEIGALSGHGTTITTTETVMETFTNFNVLAGAAYRYEIDGTLIAGTSTGTQFQIRKTNTSGQSLGSSDIWPGIGLSFAPFRHVGYFRNTGLSTITTTIVLTATTTTSTATWYADTELPRYVAIQYAGPAIEYPSAVVIEP